MSSENPRILHSDYMPIIYNNHLPDGCPRFAGFFSLSLLTMHEASQHRGYHAHGKTICVWVWVCVCVFRRVVVIDTCRFHIRPLLWLAVKIGFNEVLNVSDIEKSQVIQQVQISHTFSTRQNFHMRKNILPAKQTTEMHYNHIKSILLPVIWLLHIIF